MPRGDNPNSRKNLIKPSEQTAEERRESARRAGIASGKARKEYATLTEALKDQCTPEIKAELTAMLIKRAKAGNLKAYELLRDQMGEKPVDKIQLAQIDSSTIDEIENLINGAKE